MQSPFSHHKARAEGSSSDLGLRWDRSSSETVSWWTPAWALLLGLQRSTPRCQWERLFFTSTHQSHLHLQLSMFLVNESCLKSSLVSRHWSRKRSRTKVKVLLNQSFLKTTLWRR